MRGRYASLAERKSFPQTGQVFIRAAFQCSGFGCSDHHRLLQAAEQNFLGRPVLFRGTVGKIVLPHGAGILPWYCHNNLYCFSFPASASSFPIAQQKQPVFIKMFKKQAKKKEPLSSSKGKILSLYDFSLFFDVPVRYFAGTSKNTREISDISRFLMCFGSFRTDMPGS